MKIRPLRRDDIPELSRLNEDFYGVRRDDGFWRWKYYNNPTGRNQTVVAEADGEVVTQCGCNVLYMNIEGRRFPVGQVQDILVRKDFRKGLRQGRMIVNALKALEELAREYGTPLIYGFAIPVTGKIATRAGGYRTVTRIYKMVYPVNPFVYLGNRLGHWLGWASPLARMFAGLWVMPRRGRLPPGSEIQQVARFDQRFDRLWEQTREHWPIAVERTSDYLNWRYSDHPTVSYEAYAVLDRERAYGFIVLEVKERVREMASLDVNYRPTRRGEIVDLVVSPSAPDSVLNTLLRVAFRRFLTARVDVFSSWCQPHMPIARRLAELGFRRRETPQHLLVRGIDERIAGPESAVFHPQKWYIMRGDSDHF